MEDSMAKDTIQGSTPTVPAFRQQPITPPAFGFGMASSNIPHPPGVGISLTAVKLNDANYLLWSRAIKKYLTAQAKEKYLTDTKPADDAKEYQRWVEEDAMVTTWLWNSMEPSIATSTMWVDTTKELWDSLRDRFGLSKNISRIYDIYASFFSCQQGDKSLNEHFGVLEGLWGELNSYCPITTDEKQLRKQWEELLVVRFLSSLHPVYESAKNSILTEKELPTMKEVYARLKRLSLITPNSQETPVLLSPGGRGRGQSFRHGRGHGKGRGGCFHCSHCGCWENFEKPEWANHNYYDQGENSSALSPPENIPNAHVPQSEGSSHQSSIGNQSSSVSTALPTATLAQTAAPSSQPAFGNPSSVDPSGTAPSNNNDQIGMEDSMAKDTIQASTPSIPAFEQQPITPAASGFGFNMAAQPSPFQFSSQQNVANPQNSTLFPSSNSLKFNASAAGGSFSLGSGGGDKSNRRIVKIKSKQRRK
ncbi:hypothetical protein QYF36_019499 [Acer negundo]|nr:hypothetical protein QYF36_019499 [Acer negundo]